jgi:hypothetical protein
MRNFKKLKTLKDYKILDAPHSLDNWNCTGIPEDLRILRMLVKTKYSDEFFIPEELSWLRQEIYRHWEIDKKLCKIENSWCYITVRSGFADDTADAFHFDGGSMRVDLIPERNYVWVNKFGIEYKLGSVNFPETFDPTKFNMFTFAENEVKNSPVCSTETHKWYLLSPFCLHRRNPLSDGARRVFIRISFVDIEVRDVNCTQNPLFPTEAYGRDPVLTYRDKLTDYKS